MLDNDFSEFKRPDHYIRHIGTSDGQEHKLWPSSNFTEPIESELAVQVEYDMDEQGTSSRINPQRRAPKLTKEDKEWLDVVNAERKKEQAGPVSYEMFEIIMDKLEKEWFNLVSLPFVRGLSQ